MDKKEIDKQLKNKTEFFHILSENTANYKGKYENIMVNAPKIYNLLCGLLDSKIIYKKDRQKISSAIAYFILPKDIFPEDIFGTKGYIDDIYLCLYILKTLKGEYGIEELLKYWEESPQLLKKFLEEDYEELNKELNYILQDILDYVGIH